jgi:hypothetical protein
MATNGEIENPRSNVVEEETDEEYLYHIMREIIDYHKDKSGATRINDVLGTYVSLPAAKAAALRALQDSGYERDDFEIYEERPRSGENWPHGDGVLVYAKAPAGQEFYIRIDTKLNLTKLKGNAEGRIEGTLYYVLQTKIDFNTNRVGGIQTTEVEGTYLSEQEAREAALQVLLDGDEITKDWYAKYEEIDETDPGEWPYGEDCLVHAVSPHGENFLVFVKTQPGPHKTE